MMTPSVNLSPAFSTMSSLRRANVRMQGLFHDTSTAQNTSSTPTSSLVQSGSTPEAAAPAQTRVDHFREGLKNLLLVPVLPAIGYLGLDATGVTSAIAGDSPALKMILGEGFGHAGLCFSLHFVLSAGYHFWKTIRG